MLLYVDAMMLQGVAGLKGKTREDFYNLLDEAKLKQADEVRETVKQEFIEKQKALQAEFEAKKSELSKL